MVVAAAVLLPHLGKAFTVDDVTFLLQAQHVLSDPLHPTAFDMVFEGKRIRLSSELVTGPVMAYLLVPAVLMGGSETAAHLCQLGFLLAGILATNALALRLGLTTWQASQAALLVAASPAVLAMTATAMPDVVAMAFAVGGIERLLTWARSRRVSTGVAAAVLLALGILARPHVVLLLLPASWWILPMMDSDEGRSIGRIKRWAIALYPLVFTVAIAICVLLLTRDPDSGESVAQATTRRMGASEVILNVASYILHWAFSFPLVLLYLAFNHRRMLRSWHAWAGLAIGTGLAAAAGYVGAVDWWWLPVSVAVALGGAVLASIIGDSLRSRNPSDPGLAAWLLIGISAAVYVHLPAKVLVPSAPAMAILLARQLPPRPTWSGRLTVTRLVAAAGAVTAVLIIRADAAMAEIGRLAGHTVAQQAARGSAVWMDGGWGFQWYAMRAGATPLAETPPYPHPGDVIVASLQSRLVQRQPGLLLVSREVFSRPGGRVHGEGAGFFTNREGPWPWTYGRKEIGRIEVWRVDSTGAGSP